MFLVLHEPKLIVNFNYIRNIYDILLLIFDGECKYVLFCCVWSVVYKNSIVFMKFLEKFDIILISNLFWINISHIIICLFLICVQ